MQKCVKEKSHTKLANCVPAANTEWTNRSKNVGSKKNKLKNNISSLLVEKKNMKISKKCRIKRSKEMENLNSIISEI